MTRTVYKKAHGKVKGQVQVEYDDGFVHGTLYAGTYGELYRAVRFLGLSGLTESEFNALLSDKHGKA